MLFCGDWLLCSDSFLEVKEVAAAPLVVVEVKEIEAVTVAEGVGVAFFQGYRYCGL